MHENQAAGFQGGDSLSYDQKTVLWSHAVKDVGKPDNIIGPADVVLEVVPAQKTHAARKTGFLNDLKGKGSNPVVLHFQIRPDPLAK